MLFWEGENGRRRQDADHTVMRGRFMWKRTKNDDGPCLVSWTVTSKTRRGVLRRILWRGVAPVESEAENEMPRGGRQHSSTSRSQKMAKIDGIEGDLRIGAFGNTYCTGFAHHCGCHCTSLIGPPIQCRWPIT